MKTKLIKIKNIDGDVITTVTVDEENDGLSWANLRGQNLRRADLREEILESAYLSESDLSAAIMKHALLSKIKTHNKKMNNFIFAVAWKENRHLDYVRDADHKRVEWVDYAQAHDVAIMERLHNPTHKCMVVAVGEYSDQPAAGAVI